MTEYVILTRLQGVVSWEELDKRISARSGNSAIRSLLESEGNDATNGEEYVAIPARSFRPVKVKVETKTQLKFS